jgi:hypothetical protein
MCDKAISGKKNRKKNNNNNKRIPVITMYLARIAKYNNI